MDVAGVDENQISCPGCEVVFIDAEIGASEKKSHNQQNEWAIPIGIAHFQKEKDKSEFEKVSEWDTTIKDTMEEYDNVKR